jgi:hypothetical protein
MIKQRLGYFLLAVLPYWVSAQEANVLSFAFDNDAYFSTDHYYTNGLSLTHYGDLWDGFPTHFLLPKLSDNTVSGLGLTHSIYTPISKESLERIEGDRPFSAFLLLEFERKSRSQDEKWMIHTNMGIGLSGKAAFGGEVQNGIHELLPTSGEVAGWDQVQSTKIIFQYDLRLEYGLVESSFLEIRPEVELGIGNFRTRALAGAYFRTGKIASWKDHFFVSDQRWQLYFFSRLGWDFVLYDAGLQGSLRPPDEGVYFQRNEMYTRIGKQSFGLVCEIGRFSTELSVHMIAPEFYGGKSHRWGRISLKYAF